MPISERRPSLQPMMGRLIRRQNLAWGLRAPEGRVTGFAHGFVMTSAGGAYFEDTVEAVPWSWPSLSVELCER